MKVLFLLLVLGLLYELLKPRKPEPTPSDVIKNSIRAKEDGRIDADEFFVITRNAIAADENP